MSERERECVSMLYSMKYSVCVCVCAAPSLISLSCNAAARSRRKVAKRVPMGTSDYQAAWILESDSDQV